MSAIKNQARYRQVAFRMFSKVALWLSDDEWKRFVEAIEHRRLLHKVYEPAIRRQLESDSAMLSLIQRRA